MWIAETRRQRVTRDDVRSGIFVAFAEWAAGRVVALGMETSRGWKPNVLVPVSDPTELRGEFRLLKALTTPEGSIKLLGIATEETVHDVSVRVQNIGESFRAQDVFTTWSVMDSAGYTEGIADGLQPSRVRSVRPEHPDAHRDQRHGQRP